MGLMGTIKTKAKESYSNWNKKVDDAMAMSRTALRGGMIPEMSYDDFAKSNAEYIRNMEVPAAGFTKNGIPHNAPEVVKAYLDNIVDKLKGTGKTAIITDNRVVSPELTSAKIMYKNDADGAILGFSNRDFTPEQVYTSLTKSFLPQTKDGVPVAQKMGVIKHVYPAEAEFMEKYGGDIGGGFINRNTSDYFQTAHPGADVEPMYMNGKWVQDNIKKSYTGLLDF